MRTPRLASVLVLLVGCSSTESGSTPATADASSADAAESSADSSLGDSTAVDSAVVDSVAVDSAAVDSATADSAVVDSAVVDSAVVDSAAVDSSVTDSGADSKPTDSGALDAADAKPAGAPIVTPKSTWTWVDFPDSTCDDGTPTGLGVNLGDSANVLVYHTGGGACWDGTTCFTLRTATTGPYGSTQFAMAVPAMSSAIFDRLDPSNPFRDWSYVFVPYCTGDWHGGDNVASYVVGGVTKTYHHEGRKNVRAYLSRLTATFPSPTKVAIAGSSAGGYGAMLDYDLYRAAWPAAQSYALDDSGALLRNDDLPATLRTQFYASWRLDKFLDAQCPSCRTDLSALVKARAAAYPSDRFALLSSTQDAVMRSSYALTGPAFEAALLSLGTGVYDPTARARYFFTTGTQHTVLFNWTTTFTGTLDLRTWVRRFVLDDAAWASARP